MFGSSDGDGGVDMGVDRCWMGGWMGDGIYDWHLHRFRALIQLNLFPMENFSDVKKKKRFSGSLDNWREFVSGRSKVESWLSGGGRRQGRERPLLLLKALSFFLSFSLQLPPPPFSPLSLVFRL